jgi:hypothetical protein
MLGLVACIVAAPAVAAPLAASKASNVLTIGSGVTSCLVNGRAVDIVQNADGTTAPFVIPPKQVFVVTGIETTVLNADASAGVSVSVQRVNGVATNTLAFINGTASSQGVFYGQLTLPSGAIVKPGVTLCVFMTAPTAGTLSGFTLVHGFLAPNK